MSCGVCVQAIGGRDLLGVVPRKAWTRNLVRERSWLGMQLLFICVGSLLQRPSQFCVLYHLILMEQRMGRGFEPVASGGQKGDILLFLVLIWLLVVENIKTTILSMGNI